MTDGRYRNEAITGLKSEPLVLINTDRCQDVFVSSPVPSLSPAGRWPSELT